jgi:nucleoside-diphosphate-sugar epimerase
MGAVLKGSNRPLLITSGIGFGAMQHGDVATEDAFNANNPHPRAISEVTADALVQAGVNVSVVRLPQVHDAVKQGLITPYVGVSRDKGVVVYVGEGRNRWSAAHVLDVAKLYVLALAAAKPGRRYHAVAEEGIALRDIADVVGRGLKVPVKSITPEEAPQYLGWLSMFAAADLPASSALTRERLGWNPVGPDLITDLKAMDYSVVTKIA